MPKSSSSASIFSISDSDSSTFVPEKKNAGRGNKRKRVSVLKTKIKREAGKQLGSLDIEDAAEYIRRPHEAAYHGMVDIVALQIELLVWFDVVREKRGMPWRKRYNPDLTMEEKGQRAYEIWVSEVMLQQTQVATVIAYWRRWIEKWPTIADLAKADIEEVNAAWRGLGYYRRARSLLAGAKTVMAEPKYKGRLPHQSEVLEKEIEGVGRYTAGAICSMAYGVRTPVVDGNVHRVLTRVLAVHSPQTAPQTIKILWSAAAELVQSLPNGEGIAGDWNQALMEFGSQICKPVSPDCETCPVRRGCKAYAETSQLPTPPADSASACTLCAPITSAARADRIPSVMVFPMRKDKKVSRVQEEVVSVVEWRGPDGVRNWLFVKRPEIGLLAGLFEPLTKPIPPASTPTARFENGLQALSEILGVTVSEVSDMVTARRDVGSIPHIFSHINMTYHVLHLVLKSSSCPPLPSMGIWLDDAGVESANIGTGVKKVWAEVYGAWGRFEPADKPMKPSKKAKKEVVPEGKVVKNIMMPAMPARAKKMEVS